MRTKRAVSHDGTLIGAVDENGILIPLTNTEIARLAREQPRTRRTEARSRN